MKLYIQVLGCVSLGKIREAWVNSPFFICAELCQKKKNNNEKGTFCHKFPDFLGKGTIIQFQNISGNFLATFPLFFWGRGGEAGILLTRFCAFWTGYTNMSSFNAKSLLGSSHVTQHQNFEKQYWLPSPNSCYNLLCICKCFAWAHAKGHATFSTSSVRQLLKIIKSTNLNNHIRRFFFLYT